jgi:hypothetical protein
MRIPYQFRDVVLAALLLSCLPKVATAQQSAQQLDLPTLSPAVHSALFVNLLRFSEPDNTVRVIGNLKSMWTRDTALIGTWATIFFFVDRASRAT